MTLSREHRLIYAFRAKKPTRNQVAQQIIRQTTPAQKVSQQNQEKRRQESLSGVNLDTGTGAARFEGNPFDNPAFKLPGAGNPVYTTPEELKYAFGKEAFSQEQYSAALKSLQSGGKGVDPLGFGGVQKPGFATESGIPLVETPTPQPTPEPLTAIQREKAITGKDLQDIAAKRRKERIIQKGISEDKVSYVEGLLAQGYRFNNSTFDNRPIFSKPGNPSDYVVLDINEDQYRTVEDIRSTDFTKEAKDQVQAEADAEREQSLAVTKPSTEAKQEGQAAGTQGVTRDDMDTVDFSDVYGQLDQTDNFLKELLGNTSGMTQQVYSAFLPSLLGLQTTMSGLRGRINASQKNINDPAYLDKNPIVIAARSTTARREAQLNERLKTELSSQEENKRIALEANSLAKDMLEADKKLIELQNHETILRQQAANVLGEKRLRRSLNAAGVQDSPNSIEYLNGKIQEAADHLHTMQQSANLTTLKFDIAGKQLANDVRGILSEYNANKNLLYANHDEKIFGLDQYVSSIETGEYNKLREDFAKMLENEDEYRITAGDKITEAMTKAIEMQQEEDQNDLKRKQYAWDSAMDYIDRIPIGLENQDVLHEFESILDLPKGTLANQQSFEQLRLKRAGSVGGVNKIVQQERDRILALYPSASGEQVDTLVYASLQAQYGSTDKGRGVLRKAYEYMNVDPLNGESYRIQPLLTSSQGARSVDQALQILEDQRALEVGDMTIPDFYNDLTTLPDPETKVPMTDDQAIDYIESLGYVHVPSLFRSRGREFTKK